MSRTLEGRQWRQNKRSQERPLPEQTHLPAVNAREGECCGGRCGEMEAGDPLAILFLLPVCPSVEDIVAVFYGDTDVTVETWVDAHIGVCSNCRRDIELVAIGDAVEIDDSDE